MFQQLTDKLSNTPPWRWAAYGAVVVFAASYAVWSHYRTPPVAPGAVITALPARKLEGMSTVAIQPRQVIVYRDKIKVTEKLGIPPIPPSEEIQTAIDVPYLKYGGTAATMLNMSSGQSRTVIKANTAPWFQFKRDLSASLGAGMGSEGKTLAGRLRLDIIQIKSVVISPELEGNYAEDRKHQFEGRAMIWATVPIGQ